MKTRREFIGCGTCVLLLLGCGDKAVESPPDSLNETGGEPDPAPGFDPCEVGIEEGWTEISLTEYPDLMEVGGYVTTNIGGNSMVIAHVEEGCYAAVSSSCTHEGGAIFYSALRQQFSCQLHAATFNLDGDWALGQVTTDLRSFLVAKEGDSLWIAI